MNMDWALDDGAFKEWILKEPAGIWKDADAARKRGDLRFWVAVDAVPRLLRWSESASRSIPWAEVGILTVDAATMSAALGGDPAVLELTVLNAAFSRIAPDGLVITRAAAGGRYRDPESAWKPAQAGTTVAKVPMLDLRAEYRSQAAELDALLLTAAADAQYISGPQVGRFEKELAAWMGARHAIGVSSGTEALVLALRALALKRFGKERFDAGDKIITTPFTFVATGDAILRSGATPVFVDIDPDTLNLDVTAMERYLAADGAGVVGIVPVHLFGLPCRMGPILAAAKARGLFVVEDVAQSFGASFQGRKTAAVGDIGTLSFFPSKNLGGFGDAGAVITDDDALAEAVRMLVKHGGADKHRFEVLGYNARLDTLQAAVLSAKLPRVEANNAKRKSVARRYLDGLAGIPGLRLPPAEDQGEASVFHQFTLRTPRREGLQKHLEAKGISCMRYYPYALHRMPLFQGRMIVAGGAGLPVAEEASEHVLSLPIGPAMTDAQVAAVVAAVRGCFGA